MRDGGRDVTAARPCLLRLWFVWERFDGFAVPAAATSCVTAVKRVTPTTAVPLPVLVAVLVPDWRTKALYPQTKNPPWFAQMP